ncbi:MAG: hypothetical protein L2C94_004185 [Aigarchaeota archaeon]|nr:hypothetical protein [Candidatus Wolframiiraptor gerlachensis]
MLIAFLSLALIMSVFSHNVCDGSPQPRYIEAQITITTTGGINRFFSVSLGDTLVQVVDPLYTVSSSTTAMFTTRESFTGSVSGDLSVTINNGAFNTIWVDVTATSMRGLTIGHADYSDLIGDLQLIIVLDVDAQLSARNIVGASLKGYAFSKSSRGGYTGKLLILKLEGSLTSPNEWQFNGKGWIFDEAECQPGTFSVSGSRVGAPGELRTVPLMSGGDVVMQFTTSDITLAANASAQFTTRQHLTGTSTGALVGSFDLDSNAFIITSGTHVGKGYSVARFAFTNPDGTVDGFLILDNIYYGVHNGYIVGVSGTGAFVNKIFLGTFNGAFTNPPNYYDYEGSGSVRVCSIPPPVGGIILDAKTTSTVMLAPLWAYASLIAIIIATTMIILRRRLK